MMTCGSKYPGQCQEKVVGFLLSIEVQSFQKACPGTQMHILVVATSDLQSALTNVAFVLEIISICSSLEVDF